MSDVASQLGCLGDPRLAAHATSAAPVWLWSPEGCRILWANPVGAAIFGAPTPAALAARTFDPRDPRDPREQTSAQIARLAGSLRLDGAPRLERLRGFGGGLGRALVCACSRIALADRTPGILVAAAEPAGPTLALAERVRRLFADSGLAVAAFTPGGALLHATPVARLGAHPTLAALGADMIAADALAHGRAAGVGRHGPVTVERLGTGANTVLVATVALEPLAPPAERAVLPPREEPEVAAPPTVPAAAPEAPLIAPDAAAAPPAPQAAPTRRIDTPERRHPLRFVWQMDAAGHFTLGSDEFAEVIGPKVAATLGQPWPQLNGALALDPEEQVVRAVATRDTWSGITVSWPVEGCADRLKVELSGLPVFDRNRTFQGYRGFGVCRDTDRIATLAAMRRPAPPAPVPAAATAPPAPPEPAPQPPPPPDAEARPALTVVPAAANVVPFRASVSADPKGLSLVERSPFHELARQLTSRLKGDGEAEPEEPAAAQAVASAAARMVAEPEPAAPPEAAPAEPVADTRAPTAPALVRATGADADRDGETARRLAAAQAGEIASELADVLDAVPDGMLVIEPDGRIVAANRAAAALFGYDVAELLARRFAELLAPGSRTAALESLSNALANPAPDAGDGAIDGGREIIGQARQGATLPLRLWLGRLAAGAHICAIVRDATAEQVAQRDLAAARAALETAAAEKSAAATAAAAKAVETAAETTAVDQSEFVAKVSHELRAPLNSIVGFAEVMLEERFGPIGNERYRDYLKDIRTSGDHAVALLNDLVLLAKIAAGQLDLDMVEIDLNEVVQACVALIQPQANRERIIIRTSLAPHLPPVVADPGALRQIVVNLLSNAIRLTGAGGQVIVSTAADGRDAALRVRDTGIGMDEKELAATLEPFRQSPTAARWGAPGTGLCLPLTRALAHANRARFTISSKVNGGTLVQVAFPAAAGRAD